jgi:putative FmdB family regulatory protein
VRAAFHTREVNSKLPIYEYQCARGHQYERSEGFDAPAVQTCPTCGSRSQRQISLPAVIFKGPGFYSTDNRKGFASGGDNGGGNSFSSDGSSKDSGSESKADGGSKASGSESKADGGSKKSGSESKAEATVD